VIMTDPIADMLTRLNNKRLIYAEEVEMPYSNLKRDISRILKEEGFITDYSVEENGAHRNLRIKLKYGPNEEQVINGVKRVSRPGLRVYRGQDELPDVLGGLGIAVVSTSRGVMTDKQARKENIGGEVLCYIW